MQGSPAHAPFVLPSGRLSPDAVGRKIGHVLTFRTSPRPRTSLPGSRSEETVRAVRHESGQTSQITYSPIWTAVVRVGNAQAERLLLLPRLPTVHSLPRRCYISGGACRCPPGKGRQHPRNLAGWIARRVSPMASMTKARLRIGLQVPPAEALQFPSDGSPRISQVPRHKWRSLR